MYCYHITKQNKMCKNYICKNGTCHIHFKGKRIRFNINKNETFIVTRYIDTLEKLKNGKWKYEK